MDRQTFRICDAVPFLSLFFFAACTGGERGNVAAFQARDSAGIEIIQAGAPEYSGKNAWRELPGDIGRILEIGEDYLLTGWSDELGVDYLRLYRLERPVQ